MSGDGNQQPASVISRRQLLTRAAGGVVLLTPLGWLAARPVGARSAHSVRPVPAADFNADVALAWFGELLALVRETPGFSPPVASRAIGYAGVAAYEAVVAGMPDHVSLARVLNGLATFQPQGQSRAHHWPTAVNAALAEICRLFFPGAPAHRRRAIEVLEGAHTASAPRGRHRRSLEHGRDIARAVFEWSRSDGGHEGFLHNFPTDYVTPSGPGLWQPTPPAFQPALQPTWGSNRTFLPALVECEPSPPVPFSTDPSSAFFAEAAEVYQTVNRLDAEQLAIARFWADDPGQTVTPPGHMLSILNQVLRQQEASLASAAEAYARLGVALADSFVSCWRVKYQHNLLRPITYIRAHIDPAWGDPLPLSTPPFPEYTSGHSVQSAASAVVLSAQFGEQSFVDHTHDDRGLPARRFASFDEAATEAAVSRLYGGIHYRAAIERGLEQGRCIGRRVAALPLRR